MTHTRIGEIVDAVAARPAGLTDGTNTIARVFGMGSGLVDDPLRPGEKIQAGIPGVTGIAPFDWYVIPPITTALNLYGAGHTQIDWLVEGRLYVPRADPAPFQAAYSALGASFVDLVMTSFVALADDSPQLGGVCQNQLFQGVKWGFDANWLWLAAQLAVTEILNFDA